MSWASWGCHHPAPCCTFWHSWAVLGGKGKTGTWCQWCWGRECAPGGGSAEMQPQSPPQGVMCPQTVAATPPCLQDPGIYGEPGQGSVPPAPGHLCSSCTSCTLPTAPAWFPGASLVIPCSPLNPVMVQSVGALCLCVHRAGLDLLWHSRGGGTLRFPCCCCCSPVLLWKL